MKKETGKPRWQAARPSARQTCVFPVPELPRAITLSRAMRYSQRASSSVSGLLSDGMAVKSNVSKLFTAEKCAARMRRSTMRLSIDFFGPGETRTLADFRRSGAVEGLRGGASAELIGNKLANDFASSANLQKTYAPVDLAAVRQADAARRKARKSK